MQKDPHALTREIWAHLSQPEHTQDTVRALMEHFGASKTSITKHLHKLRDASYVTWDKGKHNSRRVVVPLVTNVKPKR